MRPSRRLLFLVLGMQVLIPLGILLFVDSRPAPFGWQMFADLKPHPTIDVVDRDGRLRRLDFTREISRHHRPEFERAEALAAFACANHDEASAVLLRRSDPPLRHRVPCR